MPCCDEEGPSAAAALLQVSGEVEQQAGDADLIILEGMGRGIETNLYAQFSVDSLKLGMIKHREVSNLAQQSARFMKHHKWPATQESSRS